MSESVNPAIAALLRKAEFKLAAAKSALKEGFPDDAASRAYYAAFAAASAALAEKGQSFSSHGRTLGAFNREFVLTGKLPADTFRKLQRLFDDRQVGDYAAFREIDRESAEEDVREAEWFVNECRRLLDSGSKDE